MTQWLHASCGMLHKPAAKKTHGARTCSSKSEFRDRMSVGVEAHILLQWPAAIFNTDECLPLIDSEIFDIVKTLPVV